MSLNRLPGIKSSRVISLADDIARSMSAVACRVAVVPGRNVIGIELPTPSARRSICASFWARKPLKILHKILPWRSAKTSAASPYSPTSRACRIS